MSNPVILRYVRALRASSSVLAAQMILLAPSFTWSTLLPSSVFTLPTLRPIPSSARTQSLVFLVLAALAAFTVPLARPVSSVAAPIPSHARARIFNAGIWTVHFGIDNEGRDSQRRMRNLIGDMQLEVVGLLETDLQVRNALVCVCHSDIYFFPVASSLWK